MPYATQPDLEAAFGLDELRALADRNRDGTPDAAVIARALEDAEAEVNSYLAARYTLPLDPVPGQIRAITCDVARYRLDSVNPRAATKERYLAALASLRDLASGKASLGSAGDAAAAAPPPPAQVQHESPPRAFSDDRLGGF